VNFGIKAFLTDLFRFYGFSVTDVNFGIKAFLTDFFLFFRVFLYRREF
jgi:hypothetical protein